MFTVIVFILVLGVIILVHEVGHFVAAKKAGMTVEEFGIGFPPRLWSKTYKGTKYSFNLLPLGGFVKIKGEDADSGAPDAFNQKSLGWRFLTLSAGILMNIALAWVLLSAALMIGSPQVVETEEQALTGNGQVVVSEVVENSPAHEAGFVTGDVILQIAGQDVKNISEVQSFAREMAGQTIVYKVERGGETKELAVTPRENPPQGEGAIGVGVVSVANISYPWYEAMYRGLTLTWDYLKLTLVGFGTILGQLFAGEPVAGDVAGPVGIAVMTGQFAKMGFAMLLHFTALLSINIAIINALPIPALDGGRILFLAIEGIRGKRMRENWENAANSIGFALLLLLIVIVTIRDVIKYF